MVVSFRTRGINQDTHKLTQTTFKLIIIKKDNNKEMYVHMLIIPSELSKDASILNIRSCQYQWMLNVCKYYFSTIMLLILSSTILSPEEINMYAAHCL
jgi:hypothetical protein